jgi:hypothetical protein
VGGPGNGEALSGINLVTNGTFASDTDWTKEASWTISGSVATYDDVNNGQYIKQAFAQIDGTIYKTFFDLSSAGTAALWFLNSNGWTAFKDYRSGITTGAYSFYFTRFNDGQPDGLAVYGYLTSTAPFSIDNIIMQAVTDVATTGVHLHSTPSATDRKMARVDSGFNPNLVTTYKLYCVQGSCLGDDYDLVRQSNQNSIILNPFTGKFLQASP